MFYSVSRKIDDGILKFESYVLKVLKLKNTQNFYPSSLIEVIGGSGQSDEMSILRLQSSS